MIGEMRDKETAAIAIQSALTGHLVLSTLHTNDAVGGITRLLDMGLEDYLLTSTLNAILAQRLVRRLCPHCRRTQTVDDGMITQLGLRRFQPSGNIVFFEPVGCQECANIGYQGRVMIVELLTMTEAIRSLIMKGADSAVLNKKAIEEGMMTIYDDGLLKVLAGMTTFAEVVRVSSEK
jgi:general secretion pathway protein E